MTTFQTFRDALKQRLHALLWRSMASDVETDTILQDVANLDRIEQTARQYEAAGKPQLASLLRQRAAAIDADSPGSTIENAMAALTSNVPLTPLLADNSTRDDEQDVEGIASEPTQPRRKRRRKSAGDNGSCESDGVQR